MTNLTMTEVCLMIADAGIIHGAGKPMMTLESVCEIISEITGFPIDTEHIDDMFYPERIS